MGYHLYPPPPLGTPPEGRGRLCVIFLGTPPEGRGRAFVNFLDTPLRLYLHFSSPIFARDKYVFFENILLFCTFAV